MHIPDGFLNVPTVATTYVVSAGGIGYALRAARKKMGEKHVPMLGILAAFIFAAQMLNFPIAGGTSGHFVGAVLAAILLGPWAALLIMSCVLLAQCLIFQDGGITALGANIFNMGIVSGFVGYGVYRLTVRLMGDTKRSMFIGGFLGAWGGVFLAATACSIELWASGTAPISIAFPAMAGWHAIIGIGEGLITTTVLGLVTVARRDLIEMERI
jgi:cobalt/nickel transport system permease protein